MNNPKAVIGIVLVFILGAASGALVTHMVHRNHNERPAKNNPAAREDMIIARLSRELGLNDGQREAVRLIIKENGAAIRQVRGQCQPRIQAIIEQGQARITTLLTQEQQEKFRSIIEERKRRHHHDGP